MRVLRSFPVLLFALLTAAPAVGDSMWTFDFGVNFFTYNTSYITTGAMYQHSIREEMDLVYGAEFGITTEEDENGDIKPSFLVPVNIGFYFPFGDEEFSYGIGTGLSPSFSAGESGDPWILVGPYLNASVRVKVHPVMKLFVRAQQDLLFGPPKWIYTGTRLQVGISF